jgi:RNA polymerase sigma-70 factor (ECF subfamily)
MTTSRALDQFLSSVEKRAFKIAQLGLRNDDDALDAVQDSMMKLVQSYSSRDAPRWRPLFYRILANRIRDMQRRRTVRGRIMAWLPARDADDEEDSIRSRRRRATIRDPPGDSNSMKPSACSKRRWPTCHRASRRLSCCEISKVSTSAKRQPPWAARKAA